MRLNNNKLFEFLLEIQNYNFEIHDEARQQFREYKKHAKVTPSFHFGPLDKLTVRGKINNKHIADNSKHDRKYHTFPEPKRDRTP